MANNPVSFKMQETREHLFIHGEAASKVWKYYANWFPDAPPFPVDAMDVEFRIRFWQLRMNQKSKHHVSIIIPCIIIWFIWTERNNVIHREATFNSDLVIDRINHHLQDMISAGKLEECQWKGCPSMGKFRFPYAGRRRKERAATIKWLPPRLEWIKLNTDGAFSAATSPAGGGGVVRDEYGRILKGFSVSFSASSSWEAELKALITGLAIAKTLGNKIWIEMDALQIINIITSGGHGSAEHRHMLTMLRNELRTISFEASHIPREGNKIADFLAKQGGCGECADFDHDSAPPLIKAMALMDQIGIPNIRVNLEEHPT